MHCPIFTQPVTHLLAEPSPFLIPQRSPVTHEERVILFLKTEEGKAIEESLVTTIKERHYTLKL